MKCFKEEIGVIITVYLNVEGSDGADRDRQQQFKGKSCGTLKTETIKGGCKLIGDEEQMKGIEGEDGAELYERINISIVTYGSMDQTVRYDDDKE